METEVIDAEASSALRSGPAPQGVQDDMPKELIRIYTDGSAHYKNGLGAWAFVVVYEDGREIKRSQPYKGVTNNKMELCAVLEGLDFIHKSTNPDKRENKVKYQIISDSEYVVNGINEWRVAWKAKKWKNVKNLPLWLAIDSILTELENLHVSITVSWVKGHNGDKYNEICDKLAHGEYKKLLEEESKVTNEI